MQNARFIEVSAGVRYWEDATLNGQDDTEGKVPLREGDRWCPVIDLESGEILNWPAGLEAHIHYKVCDDGDYWLLDESRIRIAKWRGYYVPEDFLCVGDEGFGDYIIFRVNADGKICDWRQPAVDLDRWAALAQTS